MKVTLTRNRARREETEELMELSCRCHLSWIYSNTHDVKYLVAEVCRRNALSYNVQLGSLCAHVARHYSPDRLRSRHGDLFTAEKLISKFHLVFQGSALGPTGQQISQQKTLNSLEKLVRYGRVCLVLTMKIDFKESIPNLKEFDERLTGIVRRLLSSMLLQFVPPEFSEVLLKLYLEDFWTEEEREWMEDNRRKHEDVSPYHDFFQVLSSLSYHVLNTRRALNWEHYLEILANPAAGSVEWPMVLGVRNLHRLPYPQF